MKMQRKLIYEVVGNDNNNNNNSHTNDENNQAQLNLLNCSDEITDVLNPSECTQKDMSNKNQTQRKTNRPLKSDEEIRRFFISNQSWIVILLILIIMIVIASLSLWFGVVFYASRLSNVDIVKVPSGSQVISSKTNETINKICLEPIESGPCRASIEMFAFSVDQWRCIKFIYGGCQGNSNQFASVEECEAACF
ncbi:unnamed protein product [Schistosoma rodhaini]|nr:unnamed protein product [Schistosoma rodhaini]